MENNYFELTKSPDNAKVQSINTGSLADQLFLSYQQNDAKIDNTKTNKNWKQKSINFISASLIGISCLHYAVNLDESITKQTVWQNDPASFREIYPSGSVFTDNTDYKTLVVSAHGFNGQSAETITNKLAPIISPLLPDSDISYFSLDYATNYLDINEINEQFDDIVASKNPNRIIFYGHSMGGLIGLSLAEHIRNNQEHSSAIDIIEILDGVPFGENNLRQNAKLQGKLMNSLAKAVDSTGGVLTRATLELATHSDRFVSLFTKQNLKDKKENDTILEISPNSLVNINLSYLARYLKWYDENFIQDIKKASNSLARQQYEFVKDFTKNHNNIFQNIGKVSLIYLTPEIPENDQTTNSIKAIETLISACTNTEIELEIIKLKNTTHASLEANPKSYKKGIWNAKIFKKLP